MKIHSLIYGVVALVFAAIFFVSILTMTFVILPTIPVENRGFFQLLIVLESVVVPLLSVGAITNLVKGRPVIWSTALIMTGYTLLIWLIPFAAWGGVLLYLGRAKAVAVPNVREEG